jgi:hypothetical protein
LLDRHYDLRPLPAKPLGVETFNEQRQRRFPGFLAVVIDFAELPRVHPKFASHLDVGVREVMAAARFDPLLEVVCKLPPLMPVIPSTALILAELGLAARGANK